MTLYHYFLLNVLYKIAKYSVVNVLKAL